VRSEVCPYGAGPRGQPRYPQPCCPLAEQRVPHAAIDSLEASVPRAFGGCRGAEPSCLVGQRQGLELLHQLAGKVDAGIRASRFEDWDADRFPRRKLTFRGVLHIKMVGYGSGGGCFL
jgi:hypothetical protein